MSRKDIAEATMAEYPHHTFVNSDPEDYMSDDDLTTFNGRLHNASDVDDKCDGYKSLGG